MPIVYFNGDFVEKGAVRISPDDRGFLFGDGVYEVTPAYAGRLFRADAHLARLSYSLGELRITGCDVAALGAVWRELIARNDLVGAPRALVYVQVTRGAAPRTHAFPKPAVAPTVYAYAAPWSLKADPAVGAEVITVSDIRWSRCDIKSVSLLANCLANQEAHEAGVYEALFVRDGVVLEGSHTNVFAVIGGEVRTSPATNYVLPGISRAVVLELCRAHGIPAREVPVTIQAFRGADEAFLTGTTSEVMPIARVDGRAIGSGRPGEVTRRLRELLLRELGTAAAMDNG